MRDLYLLYGFVALMSLNILATFVYMVGFEQIRANVRRAYRRRTTRS